MQDPDPAFNPPAGVAETQETGLRRILAPNPSPMTFRGTNTYLLGTQEIAVIDPGPADDAHLEAILGAIAPEARITHILVTHAHLDHSPLARPLADRTGAPVVAFGDARAGRSAVMETLAASGLMAGGEGVDTGFKPDLCVAHGDLIESRDWRLRVLHTPGHFGNHISFDWQGRLFSGDLVMGWASSLVSPPDGDLTDFMASCTALLAEDWSVFYPGHGRPVGDPAARTRWLVEHRLGRESGILDCLADGPATAPRIAARLYHDVDPALMPAATRNVLAHLVDLYGKSKVSPIGALSSDALFKRV